MKTTPQDRLRHMLDAIDAIDDLSGLNRALTRVERAAFERFFEIVSEASRHIPNDLLAAHPHIPWRGIADLGNALRHGYESIDLERLVKIARQDMTELRMAVEAMLASLDSPERHR